MPSWDFGSGVSEVLPAFMQVVRFYASFLISYRTSAKLKNLAFSSSLDGCGIRKEVNSTNIPAPSDLAAKDFYPDFLWNSVLEPEVIICYHIRIPAFPAHLCCFQALVFCSLLCDLIKICHFLHSVQFYPLLRLSVEAFLCICSLVWSEQNWSFRDRTV